jgi:type I restriction enzyme S subunit
MPDFPQGWESATLRDAALPGREGFIDGDWIEAPYITDVGIRLIQTGNLGRGTFIDKPETRKCISAASYRLLNRTSVNPGDVLICRLADPIGRACEVPDTVGDAITAVDCTIARVDQSTFDRNFLLQWLNSDRNLKAAADRAAGSTRSRISRSNLGRLPLPRPPRDEQSAIGRVLDTLDTTVRQTEAIIEKLKQVKQGLLHDLLTRGIDVNGELRPPQSQAPHLYIDSPLGWIPREWTISSIEDASLGVVDCPHSTPSFREEGVLVARTMHIKSGVFLERLASRVSEIEYHERIARLCPEPGDVIFTREAPVGEAFVVPTGMRICLGQRVMLLRPRPDKLLGEFLIAQIYSGAVADRIAALTAGTTNPHLNVAEVRQFVVPLPPMGEQVAIGRHLSLLDARMRAESAELDKLIVMKSGLMDDLLTGRVRVTALLESAASCA